MREVKFRYLVLHISDQTEIPLYYSLEQITSGEMDEYLHSGRYSILGRWQFTGLKDKNGREIYEGDVVEVVSDYIRVFDGSRSGEPPKVSRYRIGWHEVGSWNKFKGLSDEHVGIVQVFKPEIWCEVIGNIHKNPELLGDSR